MLASKLLIWVLSSKTKPLKKFLKKEGKKRETPVGCSVTKPVNYRGYSSLMRFRTVSFRGRKMYTVPHKPHSVRI